MFRNNLRWRAASPAALLDTGINSLLGPIDTCLFPPVSLGLSFKYLSAPKLRFTHRPEYWWYSNPSLRLVPTHLIHSSWSQRDSCAHMSTHTLFKSFLKLLGLSPQGAPCSSSPVPDCVCLTSNTGSVFCTELCSGRPSPWKACCSSGLLTLAYSSISAQS